MIGLAIAAPGQRPIRAGCIDVRPLFAPVELDGRIVETPSRGGAPAYDLVLSRTICVDDGNLANPDLRLARVRIYATDRALLASLRAYVGRGVHVRGQAFATFSVAQPGRPIVVVNVQAIAAAGR
jgi:hypothetical protein